MSWRVTSSMVLTCSLAVACGETGVIEPGPGPGGGAAFGTAGKAAGAAGEPAEQGGSSSQAGSSATVGAGAGGEGGHGGCNAASVAELAVFSPSWDALGYPPYAIDGCTLVYVALQGDSGELRRVDLATGEQTLLDDASHHPARPTIKGAVVAWEHDGPSGRAVTVVSSAPERSRTFEQAGEPRASADAVVFTQFLGPAASDDTDVYLYDVTTDEAQPIAAFAGQQRFADVSATHVAVTDFSEDPRGYFDEAASIADVTVIDRKTGEATTRARPGKQAFPLLGSAGTLVYLEWGAVHPEPKFSQFFLHAGRVSEPVSADFNVKGEDPVSTDVAYVRPSLHGTRVDFVDRADGVRLYSAELSAAEVEPVAATITDPSQLFGPASSERITLVSRPEQGQNLRLIAVER